MTDKDQENGKYPAHVIGLSITDHSLPCIIWTIFSSNWYHAGASFWAASSHRQVMATQLGIEEIN